MCLFHWGAPDLLFGYSVLHPCMLEDKCAGTVPGCDQDKTQRVAQGSSRLSALCPPGELLSLRLFKLFFGGTHPSDAWKLPGPLPGVLGRKTRQLGSQDYMQQALCHLHPL